MIKQSLAIAALCLAASTAQSCPDMAMTVSLASKHLTSSSVEMNEFNPGIGADCGELFQVGAYYNSLKRASIYLGKAKAITPHFGIKYGAVTGYDIPIAPYAAGYARVGNLELTLIPRTGYNPAVVGLSVRW